MRVAYVVVAHQLPEQLVRLVQRLRGPDTVFVVHVDRKMDDAGFDVVRRGVGGSSDVTLIDRRVCHWGTFSVVQATLDGLRHAVRDEAPFDHVVLLSGQDYPIKPRHEINAFLERARGRSHVHHVALPKPDWRGGGWDRVQRWHFPPGRANRRLERAANRFATPRRFPDGFRPYAGAQFWSMSRRAAEYVVDFTDRNPSFLRFFHHVFVPDEFFFHTILANSPLRTELVNETLTFLEWYRPGAVLVSEDMDNLRSTHHLFARKFDARVDGAVLDRIDSELLGAG